MNNHGNPTLKTHNIYHVHLMNSIIHYTFFRISLGLTFIGSVVTSSAKLFTDSPTG